VQRFNRVGLVSTFDSNEKTAPTDTDGTVAAPQFRTLITSNRRDTDARCWRERWTSQEHRRLTEDSRTTTTTNSTAIHTNRHVQTCRQGDTKTLVLTGSSSGCLKVSKRSKVSVRIQKPHPSISLHQGWANFLTCGPQSVLKSDRGAFGHTM